MNQSRDNTDRPDESQVFEGEIVSMPEKKKTQHQHKKTQTAFNIFAIPVFAKLRRNCLLSLIAFLLLTAASIYFKNPWLFFLAVLLPPWIFSQRR